MVSTVDENRLTTKHISMKFLNLGHKEKVLEVCRGKSQVSYKGSKIRMALDFVTTVKAGAQ